MEQRRRIRDITHANQRWIASVVANDRPDEVWLGHLVFFLDEPNDPREAADALEFQAYAFDQVVAQATSLSPEEIHRRLSRALGEAE